jgi:hypothetical protein
MDVNKQTQPSVFLLEYHQLVFKYLHGKLENSKINPCSYHPVRNSFWSNIPPGNYTSDDGIDFMNDYLFYLETEISEIVSKNSIAYWIHLLRRIACTLPHCGDDRDRSSTLMIVRSTFEACIQKYASIEPCIRIGFSGDLEIDEILGGFFKEKNVEQVIGSIILDPELNLTDYERVELKKYLNDEVDQIVEYLQEKPQLVLTNFGLNELNEFYELENLMFEVWRSYAELRGFYKGASCIVKHNPGDVFEDRDNFLEESISIFDERHSFDIKAPFTAKGTFYPLIDEKNHPITFIPSYNVGKINTKSMIESYSKKYSDVDIHITKNSVSNFIWLPINMYSYYKSNLNYSIAFEKTNKVNFESVIVVFTILLYHVLANWKDPMFMLRCWQRGYEGPFKKVDIFDILQNDLSSCIEYFGLSKECIDLEKGFDFWALTEEKKKDIGLSYPGPHSIFIPYGKDRYFIDYAWMDRRLFDLFWNCRISDENFKGTALETLIQGQQELVLPTKECKSFSGDTRQIDASFERNDVLLIIECKSNDRSIGFYKGTKESLAFRKDTYNEKIEQVDDKAAWLIKEIKGTNFDISKYRKIIPIVITPFVEYIPYDERKYWISDIIPRILTPSELIDLIGEDELWKSEENVLFNKLK